MRKTLAADKSWGEKAAPMLELFTKQENLTMRLFPWSSVVADVKPGGKIMILDTLPNGSYIHLLLIAC